MTTFGDQVYQYGGTPVNGAFTTGKSYFVKPYSGSDNNDGKSPRRALKTIAAAHTKATADAMDVIYLVSESQSMAYTTDWQSSTLTISKDGTKLIGINSGNNISPRSRIGQLTATTGVAPLMAWSADNGSLQNVLIAHEIADATSLGAFYLTGQRNYFRRVHFAGCLDDTMDAANQYSLRLGADASENLFEECVIGADTIKRGSAAGHCLWLSGGTASNQRNVFRNCIFLSWAEHATNAPFLTIAASTLDRWILFDNCVFINSTEPSGGTAITEAFNIGATQNGKIILHNCTSVGVTNWELDVESGFTYIDSAVPTNTTSGIAIAVESA